MKTINYASRERTSARGPLALVRSVMLPRARWHRGRPLPLVRSVTLYHPKLPLAFEGLRIVQVSDVHAGTFMPPPRLDQVRATVEALAPDLVVFTGDQLDRRDVDADLFVEGFAGISAPLGVFGVLGNHDHLAGAPLALEALKAVGVTPLVNSAAVLEAGGSRVLLAGVDDLEAGPGWGPDFSVLWRTQADFRMLLCHQPRGWSDAFAAGANITLAGHTHGGQIGFRAGDLSVARLGTPFVAGPYLRGEELLYVSRGVGVGAVPIRFGSPPEVDLLTLRRGNTAAS